jgi:hypothetical protein
MVYPEAHPCAIGADIAACAWPVFYDEGLAQPL